VIIALWVQRRIHVTDISRLNETHDAAIARLGDSHEKEISRQTKTSDDMITLLKKTADQRATDSYAAGLGAAHPYVYRGVAVKKGGWISKKRDIALAIVFSDNNKIFGIAGDCGDLEEFKLPPEVKKAIAIFLTHGGNGLPGLSRCSVPCPSKSFGCCATADTMRLPAS
jgi:hypothetical protein